MTSSFSSSNNNNSDFSPSAIREITIDSRGASTSQKIPGLFALFDHNNSNNNNERTLELIIVDGQRHVFRTFVTARQVKETSNVPSSEDPLEFVLRLLGAKQQRQQQQQSGSESLNFILVEDDDSLRIQVSQRLPSGLVRKPWSATLQRGDSSNTNNNMTLLTFTKAIVERGQALEIERKVVERNLDALREAREGWKDTAEKLEGQWEEEKTELLQNFLTLYSKKKEYTQQMQERVKELEEQLEQANEQLTQTKEELAQTKAAAKRNRTTTAHDLENEPDDMNELLYDQDEVNQLAAGQRVARKRKTTARGASNEAATSDTAPPGVKRARNPLTGAMEYYDISALEEDPALRVDENDAKPPSTNGRKINKKPAAAAVAAKKPPPPPAAAATKPKKPPAKSQKKKASSQQLDDDSDTASDVEDSAIFDSDMQLDIHAQLAALKEAEEGDD